MNTYTIAHLGCGGRGMEHVRALSTTPDGLHLVALCDQDTDRLDAAARVAAGSDCYTDARTMLEIHRPDVFSFVTQPPLRLPLVRLGIELGVKVISVEKPMALTLSEARAMWALANESGVQLVICHQHKYGGHWMAVKSLIDRGELGDIQTIHAASQGWMAYLATHLIDYALWLNQGQDATWAVGHAHGYLEDDGHHPSPEYLFSQAGLANGVRLILECGPLATDLPPYKNPAVRSGDFWMDAGVTVVGTDGMAQVVVGNGWSAITRNGGAMSSNEHRFDGVADTALYYQEIVECLNDPTHRHACRAEVALHGFEILAAMCASALDNQRIELPLIGHEDVFERLRDTLLAS